MSRHSGYRPLRAHPDAAADDALDSSPEIVQLHRASTTRLYGKRAKWALFLSLALAAYTYSLDGGSSPIGFSGLHVVCRDRILDLNAYDISRNIYGPPHAHGRVLRNTKPSDYSGAVHEVQESQSISELSGPVFWTTRYRQMKINMPPSKFGDCFHFIEDEDGPKVRNASGHYQQSSGSRRDSFSCLQIVQLVFKNTKSDVLDSVRFYTL